MMGGFALWLRYVDTTCVPFLFLFFGGAAFAWPTARQITTCKRHGMSNRVHNDFHFFCFGDNTFSFLFFDFSSLFATLLRPTYIRLRKLPVFDYLQCL